MEVFKDYPFSEEKWEKVMKKLKTYHSKYGDTYGLEMSLNH